MYMDELRTYLQKILRQPIQDLRHLHNDVNTLCTFKVKNDSFIVKVMTRKPLDIFEQQRYLRSKLLLDYFSDKIPVPEVIHADNLQQTLDGKLVYATMILKRVNGIALNYIWKELDTCKRELIAKEIADILKVIHSTPAQYVYGDMMGTFWNMKISWIDYLKDKFLQAIEVVKTQKVLPISLISEAKSFVLNELIAINNFPISKAVILHQDLWAANLLVDNDRVKAIIDWEWSSIGEQSYDLTYYENELFCKDENAIKVFTSNYQLDTNFKYKKKVYKIIQHFNGAAFGYLFHNPSEEGYKSLEKQISELLCSHLE